MVKVGVPMLLLRYSDRLAFAMTINKSQGQSMNHMAVDLQSRNCFNHRYGYVALSSVKTEMVIRIYKNFPCCGSNGNLIRLD